jgi:tRNA nucleotidyltransferase (CCA-adding enzyme)
MTHEVSTISPREPIEDALSLMIEHDVGRLPVVSDGKIVGIITRTDLIAALYMKLPEDLEPLDEL